MPQPDASTAFGRVRINNAQGNPGCSCPRPDPVAQDRLTMSMHCRRLSVAGPMPEHIMIGRDHSSFPVAQAPRRCAAAMAAVICVAVSVFGGAATAAQPFDVWLQGLRQDARAAGISAQTLDSALTGLQPDPKVVELDRRQPEGTITMAEYLDKRVSRTRIEKGRELMAKWRPLLERIGRRFGVQPRFIVALWGLETNYGSYTGGFSVIRSLATLAHDERRSAFFRKELIYALRILDEGHISPDDMKGSWAGAMGQSQFMPSSFIDLAIDYDGDGRRDIWLTQEDVFGSIAHYLSRRSKWNDNETWGRPVRLPRGFSNALVTDSRRNFKSRMLSDWQRLGVRKADGSALPAVAIAGSIIQPDGPGTQAYMVYDNFEGIMRWNASFYFGVSVGLLSDALFVEPW